MYRAFKTTTNCIASENLSSAINIADQSSRLVCLGSGFERLKRRSQVGYIEPVWHAYHRKLEMLKPLCVRRVATEVVWIRQNGC